MKLFKSLSFWISFIIGLVAGIGIVFLGFLISGNYELLGWVNSLFFAVVILFASAWLLLMTSTGFFDMLFYSTAAFVTTIFRVKKMRNYYEYTQRERKIDKSVFWGVGFATIVFLIAGIIVYIIFNQHR